VGKALPPLRFLYAELAFMQMIYRLLQAIYKQDSYATFEILGD
jgi:hypothetical protein